VKRAQRQGYTLIHCLLMLPIIAATSTVTYRLVTRIVRFEELAYRQVEQDATMRDVVRRIRADAATAVTASTEGNRLRLSLSDREVTYESVEGSVTRTEQRNEDTQVFEWKQEKVNSEFRVETIVDRPAVIWLTFTHILTEHHGQDRVRSLSAAAAIGRGGAS
jgi:type II secretory pathway component PulJ